jgi:23S rRNA (uracil1939-C5)-methyltransferase
MSISKHQFTRKRTMQASQPKTATDTAPHLVEITKPLYGGQFLARLEGKAVFVPLVLPGEQVRVRITEEKKSYSVAEPVETVLASPDRRAPACPHFGICGGCSYQHAACESQLAMKESILRETLTRSGVTPTETIDLLAADPWAYRNRIRLAFDAHGKPGYRSRRSHTIVPIRECPIAAPALISAAQSIAEACRNARPPLRLSELSLFCNHDESALLATFFVQSTNQGSDPKGLESVLRNIAEQVPALKGIEVVTEENEHQPARTLAQWGESSISYRAGGLDYRVDHGAFFQVNRWLIDTLIDCVVAKQSGSVAWDLFAGVGLFARQLAKNFAKVIAVESAPNALAALEANLAGTTASAVRATTLDFLRSAAQSSKSAANAHRLEVDKPDLVIVDPPRTGLGPEVTALLAHIAPEKILYVSCDPATLARDLRALIDAGYSIHSIALADLFPQTYHLESIVELHLS